MLGKALQAGRDLFDIFELEYLLISKIYRMNLETNPKIALMAPYQEKAVEPEMQALLGFDVPLIYCAEAVGSLVDFNGFDALDVVRQEVGVF